MTMISHFYGLYWALKYLTDSEYETEFGAV